MCNWSNDDLFQKLSLNLAKYSQIDGICNLAHACSSRNFLFVATDFYPYGSVFFQIRRLGGFSEQTALTIIY